MSRSVESPRPLAEEVLDGVPRQAPVGGEWRDGEHGLTLAVEDPATGETVARVADTGPADVAAAMDAAAAAHRPFAALAPRERSDLLRGMYDRLWHERDSFARIIALEMGKPLAEAHSEVAYAADFLRWFSESAPRINGRYTVAPDGRTRMLVMRQGVGPCLLVTPWNFPLAMFTRKVAPAFAAGCPCVLKPAGQTPLTALAFAALVERAGAPPGALSVLPTSRPRPLIAAAIADDRLRKLSFTGSTEVGRVLLAQAANGILRTSMELGGNAPLIVFDDADLDQAVDGAVLAKLRNGGESCTAANRMYVHSKVAGAFGERLAERLAGMRLGHGLDPHSQVGPLIDEPARRGVEELVNDAVGRGARVLTGGGSVAGPGFFFEPTVLVDVAPTARLLHEEVFGPVAPLVTFENEEEALEFANATRYGLVAFLFTRDLSRALRVSERLETGMIGVNRGMISNAAAPFGGVKQSGLGREGGHEGLDEYLDTKYLAIEP